MITEKSTYTQNQNKTAEISWRHNEEARLGKQFAQRISKTWEIGERGEPPSWQACADEYRNERQGQRGLSKGC